MSFLEYVLLTALFIGAGAGINALCECESYLSRNNPLKTLLAFLIGGVAAVFFPAFVALVSRISTFFTAPDTLWADIVHLIALIVGPCAGFFVGVYVYHRLCNQTMWGRRIGYLFYAVIAGMHLLAVYSEFLENDILSGFFWIVAIAVGLVGEYKFSRQIAAD